MHHGEEYQLLEPQRREHRLLRPQSTSHRLADSSELLSCSCWSPSSTQATFLGIGLSVLGMGEEMGRHRFKWDRRDQKQISVHKFGAEWNLTRTSGL